MSVSSKSMLTALIIGCAIYASNPTGIGLTLVAFIGLCFVFTK